MMNRAKLMKSRSIGFVLALVLFLIVVMLVIGGGLLTLGANARIYAIRTAADTSAHCAADAGLTKTLWLMNHILATKHAFSLTDLPPGTGGGPLDPGWNCDATFSYKVAPYYGYVIAIINPGGSAVPNQYVVESTGRCGVAERKVYGLLRLQGAGECGVMVQEVAILKADTTVAGRDSGLAPDDLGQFSITAQIGTASTADDRMVLYNGVSIGEMKDGVVVSRGDVLVGFGGNPDDGIQELGTPGPIVTGYRGTLDEEPYFPPVTAPTGLYDWKIPIEAKGETKMVGPIGYPCAYHSGKYTSISLKRDKDPGVLEIVGGKVVLHITGDVDTGDIYMGKGCEIRITKGASLELYVGGNIKSGEDSGFNNQGLPPDLKLWGLPWDQSKHIKRPNFDIKAKSEYFGLIYAPDASVQVDNGGNLYGAFTCYSFELKNSGNLFYDAALSKTDITDPAAHFVMTRWREE